MGDNISEEVRCLKQVLNTLWPWVIWRCSSHFQYLWNLVGEQDGYPTHKPRWDAGENGGKTPVPTGEVQWSHSEQQQGYQEVRACGGQKLGDLEVSIDGKKEMRNIGTEHLCLQASVPLKTITPKDDCGQGCVQKAMDSVPHSVPTESPDTDSSKH